MSIDCVPASYATGLLGVRASCSPGQQMKHIQEYSTNLNTKRNAIKSPYAEITEKIIAAIESGTATSEMPWHHIGNPIPKNVETGKTYRGINTISLWLASLEIGYAEGTWGTYKQWHDCGCQVRKGEKATSVVYWDTYNPSAEEEQSQTTRSFCKRYSVFNCAQVDHYIPDSPLKLDSNEQRAEAESFFLNIASDVRVGGNTAGYSKSGDFIRIPNFDQFIRSEGYYATLAHEHVHWSGHEMRLNRDLSGRFGDSSYAMEELIAELGAAFLCAELGVPTRPREDHAGYIASWLRVLKNDSKAIFTAAASAQKAVDYLVEQSTSDPILVGKALVMATKRVFALSY